MSPPTSNVVSRADSSGRAAAIGRVKLSRVADLNRSELGRGGDWSRLVGPTESARSRGPPDVAEAVEPRLLSRNEARGFGFGRKRRLSPLMLGVSDATISNDSLQRDPPPMVFSFSCPGILPPSPPSGQTQAGVSTCTVVDLGQLHPGHGEWGTVRGTQASLC